MRFIVAIISFVVAFAMIGLGIAQRTVLAEPDKVVAEVQPGTAAPITLIDGAVLNALDGRQTIRVTGHGELFAAYGRTSDVEAWVGDAPHNRVGFDEEDQQLTSQLKRGADDAVPDPRGSDLWLDEFSHADAINFVINVPKNITVILASNGTDPAPASVSIAWPLDNRMPWSTPLIIGGVIVLLLGIALYLWALAHLNRSRGPRRKQPKLPKPPKRPRYRPGKTAKQPIAAPRGRRAAGRMTAVVPVLVVGSILLAGCSASTGSPLAAPAASVAQSATAEDHDDEQKPSAMPPAVTMTQLNKIMSRLAVVASEADETRDTALAATRFTGPALQARTANYTIRGADSGYARPTVIPAGEIKLALPQQTDSWPRTVLTVVQEVPLQTAAPKDEAAEEEEEAAPPAPPVALVLVQDSPRENFKVAYAVTLVGGTLLPEVAVPETGTARLKPDVKLLAMAPADIAAAYGDIVLKGEASEFYELFDTENDALLPSIGKAAKDAISAKLPSIASISFTNALGEGDVVAMATVDTGAIVAVHLTETETVKPQEAGATINAEGAVKSLSGVSGTLKGTVATYGDQLLFYVPPANSGEKIRLLGFSSQLIAAKELK